MLKKTLTVFIALMISFCFAGSGFAEGLTPQLAKEKATAAGKLLETEGDAAIAKIKDAGGEFRFADGKGYIWIHNLDGDMVMHPIKPSLDGKPLLQIRDVNGVYLFAAMNEIVEEYDKGWIPYAWPKPGEEKSSPKISYCVLVKHGDKDYVAGAGMYDVTAKDIKTLFPEDIIYED
jgi:signal transduction histidine kinase